MTWSRVRGTTICPSVQPSRFLSCSFFQICLVQEVLTLKFFNIISFSRFEILSKRGLAPLEPNLIAFVIVTGIPKYFWISLEDNVFRLSGLWIFFSRFSELMHNQIQLVVLFGSEYKTLLLYSFASCYSRYYIMTVRKRGFLWWEGAWRKLRGPSYSVVSAH